MNQHIPYVLATRNHAKIAEYADITTHYASSWVPIPPPGQEPVENGTTFAENALIKARAAQRMTGLTTLADDSGLCVDILGGAPGIFSAYWAGQHKNLTENRALLLDQLSDIADPARTARFASALVLIEPDGTEHVAEAEWRGRLARAPQGDDGFPYDSIFIPEGPEPSRSREDPEPSQNRTVAEWDARTRHLASHRAAAFRQLIPVFDRLAAELPRPGSSRGTR